MTHKFVTEASIKRRHYWINEIVKLSGSFGSDASRVEDELGEEYARDGLACLLDHLRLCGTIPETYGHDSSEEKLYSKYTDALLAVAFRHLGLASAVLKERGDAADVDCVAASYSFVADAKAFRMSRTAKNQKDFKVEAMAGWKREKPHAAVICPVYHLPTRSSQIYQQAGARKVAILTYSHLAVMCKYSSQSGEEKALQLLHNVFTAVESMNPTKEASIYWKLVNSAMHQTCSSILPLWQSEILANAEALEASRQESLDLLATEIDRFAAMTHEQAITALLQSHNLYGRKDQVKAITNGPILKL